MIELQHQLECKNDGLTLSESKMMELHHQLESKMIELHCQNLKIDDITLSEPKHDGITLSKSTMMELDNQNLL